MTLKRAMLFVGLLLILAALLVTGTSYREHGDISSEIMIASAIALGIGLGLMMLGGKKSSE